MNNEETTNDLDVTRFDDDDDDSKLDLNSVLSGNNTEENEDFDNMEDVFGFSKNLGAIFDSAQQIDQHLAGPAVALSSSSTAPPTTRPATASCNPSRPPLAPGRPATASSASLRSNDDGRKAATPSNNATNNDKRLTVFLRVRPPVSADGKKGNEGSINTIEVVNDKSATQPSLPTTIRTYPPLNSNAAKVVRGGSKHSAASSKDALSSKSLIDDGSVDSSGGYARSVFSVHRQRPG